MICIDARHAKAALDMAANKTDANDADGLAHLAEVGFSREVRVKSFDSMLARTLVAERTRLVRIGTELSNQIRGLMKTFGLIVPPVMGSKFERHPIAGFAGWSSMAQCQITQPSQRTGMVASETAACFANCSR